jgi:hypothetical protein
MAKPVGRLMASLLAVLAVGAGLVGCTAERMTLETPAPNPLPVVQGTWSFTTSHEDLQRSGVTDAGALDTNASSSVIEIRGARFTIRSTPQAGFDVDESPTTGRLTAASGAVVFHWGGSDRTRATPHRLGNGEVEFTDVHTAGNDPQAKAIDKAVFTRRPWVPLASAVQGTWTVTVQADDLRLAGVDRPQGRDGWFVLMLQNGQWVLYRNAKGSGDPRDAATVNYGDYRLQGDRMTFTTSNGPTRAAAADVIPNPEGGLTFSDARVAGGSTDDRASVRVLLTAEPWALAR